MERPFRTRQRRGGEHLSHRDIHIRHAVFEIRLFFRILKGMEHYPEIGSVPLHPPDQHIFPQVKGIDDPLLHLLIKPVIQGIDPDHLIENLRKALSDLRRGKGDDGEAPLLLPDIAVLDFPCGGAVFYGKLLLLRG